MANRMQEDDVILSKLSEEADFKWNQSRSDRVVVVGMKATNYPPGLAQRKEYLSKRMLPLIEKIVGEKVVDFYPKPTFLKNDRVPPFMIRFPTEADCSKFKREAYKEAQKVNDLKTLGFHPCVTPATRVRVEVLRAISKKLIRPEVSSYCPIYGIRPLLHIGPKVDGKVQTKETLTYVTAVLRFRHVLTIRDLYFAYQTVGDGFSGCLRQTFIVLNEEDRKNSKNHAADQPTRGTKRTNPDATESRTKR